MMIRTGSLGPVGVLLLFLVSALFMPLIAAPSLYYSWAAILWLLLGLIAFGAGVTVMLQPTHVERPRRGIRVGTLPVVALSLLATSGIPVLLSDRQLSAVELLALNVLLEASRDFAVARYHEGYEPPLSAKVLVGCGYAAAALFGYLSYDLSRRSRMVVGAIVYFPLIAFSFLLTSRAILMYGMVLGVSGLYASRVLRIDGADIRRAVIVRFAELGKFAVAGGLFLVFFVGVQMVRYGWTDISLVAEVLSKLEVWMLGHTSAFCYWWDVTPAIGAFQLNGRWTFGGLFQLFGHDERVLGIFSEYAPISQSSSTNVYTGYRALVMDFGVVGGLVLVLFIGFCIGYFSSAGRRWSVTAPTMLVACVSYLLWSPIASIWAYNTIIMSYGIFFAVLFFCNCLRGDERAG